MNNYPQELPTEHVSKIIDMLRKRDRFDKQEFAFSVWILQGYLQNKIIGQSLPVFGASGPMNDQEVIETLEQLNNKSEDVAFTYLPLGALLRWAISKLLELI